MSIVRDPIAKAHKATTSLQASRLYQQLGVELAYNPSTAGTKWESDAEAARSYLEEQYGADHLDDPSSSLGPSENWSPNLSPAAERSLREEDEQHTRRQAAEVAAGKVASNGHNGATGKSRAGSRERARAHARRSVYSPRTRRVARGAFRATGIPGTAVNWTRTVLNTFGVTFGLVLLYVLLSRQRRGFFASEVLASTAAQFILRLASPKADILPGGKPVASTSTAAAAIDAAAVKLGGTPQLPFAMEPAIRAGLAAGPPAPSFIPPVRHPHPVVPTSSRRGTTSKAGAHPGGGSGYHGGN